MRLRTSLAGSAEHIGDLGDPWWADYNGIRLLISIGHEFPIELADGSGRRCLS